MSSEIIAAIDKELEDLLAAVAIMERERDETVAGMRNTIKEYRAKSADITKAKQARIKHLERVRKVETGEAKVVVKRDGGAE